MICSYPSYEGRFGSISTSRQSPGPIVNSVLLYILGRICLVSVLMLAMQYGQLDECSSVFPGYSGVGNENVSSLSSGRSTCNRALMYVTTSSFSVNRLSAAMSTGQIIFVSSGLKICNFAKLVSALIALGKSDVLAIFMATFLSLAVVIAGATISFAHSSNCGWGCIVPVIE